MFKLAWNIVIYNYAWPFNYILLSVCIKLIIFYDCRLWRCGVILQRE